MASTSPSEPGATANYKTAGWKATAESIQVLRVGYYFHIGKNYNRPTGSFTYNTVYAGQTQIRGTNYPVSKWQPNGSVHVGWEFGK